MPKAGSSRPRSTDRRRPAPAFGSALPQVHACRYSKRACAAEPAPTVGMALLCSLRWKQLHAPTPKLFDAKRILAKAAAVFARKRLKDAASGEPCVCSLHLPLTAATLVLMCSVVRVCISVCSAGLVFEVDALKLMRGGALTAHQKPCGRVRD